MRDHLNTFRDNCCLYLQERDVRNNHLTISESDAITAMARGVVGLFLLCGLRIVFGEVQFDAQPSNTSIKEGEMVPCYCNYTGTNNIPYWRVNETVYHPNDLPFYSAAVNSSGLFFEARLEWNTTTLQCFFVFYNTTNGLIQTVSSTTGTVIIYDDPGFVPPDVLIGCSEEPSYTGVLISSRTTKIFWVSENCADPVCVREAKCSDGIKLISGCKNQTCRDCNITKSCAIKSPLEYSTDYVTSDRLLFLGTGSALADDQLVTFANQTDPWITGSVQAKPGQNVSIPIPSLSLLVNDCITQRFCIMSIQSITAANKCYSVMNGTLPPGYKIESEQIIRIDAQYVTTDLDQTLYTSLCDMECCNLKCGSCGVVSRTTQLRINSSDDDTDTDSESLVPLVTLIVLVLPGAVLIACVVHKCKKRHQENLIRNKGTSAETLNPVARNKD